ncbi:acyl-CoA dehydrogenase family protein [Streptomyces sp. NPDC095613]|uniref:acyl-CoA dehydrogenase family protein n=1 Tax=Streptomyces sp. NPDC095613 TaxID=3155540 RepID=UPI00332C62A3
MDEGFLTKEHERLRERVRGFAEAEIEPRVAWWEKTARVEKRVPGRMARRGWAGVTIPAWYGGMDAGHLAKVIMIEEVSRVSGAMGAALQASQLGVAALLHFGTEKQKEQWLPKIAAGRCLPTIAVTEAGSGGHVLGMEATARREGDEYVLNGRKVFVGNSHISGLHGVVARTGSGTDGLSAFLVKAGRPGLSLAPHQRAMGLHGFSFGELILDDCRIPVANRLGEEGDGLAVAYSSSTLYGRPNLAAVALGLHQAIVDTTLSFVTERHRYGHALADHPTIRQKVGLMQSRLMTARVTLYHAAHLLDHGQPCDAELMNAKLINVESALDSARVAMQIHAASGLLTGYPIERYVRDAFHLYAPAGTSDIQVHRLAEAALNGTTPPQWSERFPTPPPRTTA